MLILPINPDFSVRRYHLRQKRHKHPSPERVPAKIGHFSVSGEQKKRKVVYKNDFFSYFFELFRKSLGNRFFGCQTGKPLQTRFFGLPTQESRWIPENPAANPGIHLRSQLGSAQDPLRICSGAAQDLRSQLGSTQDLLRICSGAAQDLRSQLGSAQDPLRICSGSAQELLRI